MKNLAITARTLFYIFLLFGTVAAAAGLKNPQFAFFYEGWRVIESGIRWSTSDKGAKWEGWSPVDESPASSEELEDFIENGF